MLASATLLAATPGCSVFAPASQSVVLQSNDPAATLYADGRPVGTGSATVRLRKNRSHTFRAESPDGRSATAHVGSTISTVGVVDVVGGVLFLVPFAGALAPGFWVLDNDRFYLDLPPAMNHAPRVADVRGD